MALRLIRKNNQEVVTAYDDATLFHLAKGHDYTGATRGGIFQGVYNSFGYIVDNANTAGAKFILKSGMGMLYGRQFELPGNETQEFLVASMSSGAYVVIYVEISIADGKEEVAIKSAYSRSGYPSIGNTDNYKYKMGTATMPLYRFRVVDGKISGVEKMAYVYEPGTAEKARALDGEATINGKKVNEIVDPAAGNIAYVYHSHDSDQADRASAIGDNVGNSVDDQLYFKNRNAYMLLTKELKIKTDSSEHWAPGSIHPFTYTVPSGITIGLLIHSNITLHMRDGKEYTGTSICQYANLGSSFKQHSNNSYVNWIVEIKCESGKLTFTVNPGTTGYSVEYAYGTITVYVISIGGK